MIPECVKRATYNTNIAKFRMILNKSIKAHSEMRAQTGYDTGFQRGMEHVLYLLDNFMIEEWKKQIMKGAENEQ